MAGGVGLGSAKAVQNADNAAGSQKYNMMWVDTDGCVSVPQYCKYFITTVGKGIQASVKAAVTAAANGTFKGGTYVGDLSNGGVTLSPLPRLRRQGPGTLQSEMNTIKQRHHQRQDRAGHQEPGVNPAPRGWARPMTVAWPGRE